MIIYLLVTQTPVCIPVNMMINMHVIIGYVFSDMNLVGYLVKFTRI